MPERIAGAPDVIVGLAADGRVSAETGAVVRSVAAAMAREAASRHWQVLIAHPGVGAEVLADITAPFDGRAGEVTFALTPSDTINVPYHGVSGRARALHAILQEAHRRQARGCVIVDPRSTVAREGIEHLAGPLLDGSADFVAPFYRRHPFAGALVHGIVYPMFRALYGARLRYPLAADFSCSMPLIDAVLDEPVWQTESAQIGIDLWMPATALSGGFRVAQAGVGPGSEERPSLDLSTTLSQVVGFLFADMERRAEVWQRIRGSRAVPLAGELQPAPDPPEIDVSSYVESFRLASRELQDVWAEVLPPLAILQWRRLASVSVEAFRVDPALWARTIYDFAMGHRLRVIAREHLLRSLTPLYLAWLASFILEVRHLGPDEAEARIERLCSVFEAEKPYLVSQWRWPERFKPVKFRR